MKTPFEQPAPFRCWLLAIGFTAALIARPAGALDRSAAATIFLAKCALCHAADGSGDTVVGKSANIPDLRSPQVQQQADAHLEDVIAHGAGAMPAFATSLSSDEIQALVSYARELAARQ